MSPTLAMRACGDALARLGDDIGHHAVDEAADRLVYQARLLDAGMARLTSAKTGPTSGTSARSFTAKSPARRPSSMSWLL